MDTDEGLARDWLEGIAQLFAHVVIDVEAAPAPRADNSPTLPRGSRNN